MLQRILDLCVPLQDGVPADSRGHEMSLEYMRHKGTIDQWARRHKGLDPITLPNGGGFARDHVRRSSHNRTPSTRRVPAVRRWRTASGQGTRRRRDGSSSRISTWIFDGLPTDRPSPALTCKKRWSASSIRLIDSTSSSSTPVNALVCPIPFSPGAGWGGVPLSYIASRRVHVVGTDARSWDGHNTSMAPRFATADVGWRGEGYRGATETALARLISTRTRLGFFQFRSAVAILEGWGEL
jgi:hypothetical protein